MPQRKHKPEEGRPVAEAIRAISVTPPALVNSGSTRGPRRLSGLSDKMANGAPHSEAGSITPAPPGLPFASSLAARGEAGK